MIPAILATSPASHLSPRYKFIPTSDYVSAFEEKGWSLTKAESVRTRGVRRSIEHAKHLLTFSRGDLATLPELGGLAPRIHVVNSHDGSSRFSAIMGILRLVCTNGLMVSSGEVAAISFRHDSSARDVASVVSEMFASDATDSIEKAKAWADIHLSDERRIQLAIDARNLRFGEAGEGLEPRQFLNPARSFDAGNSLWSTFNVLQENLMGGGMRWTGMRRASRPITNIDKKVTFNKGLWALAEVAASGA